MGEKQHAFDPEQPPPPPPFWQAGNYYQPGNVVWWAGSVWKCERAHTSGPFNREVCTFTFSVPSADNSRR